jgi:hypothetical protein
MPLYEPDKLHPTQAGSYLAALVITHGLTGVPPNAIPASLTLANGGLILALPEEQAKMLRQAAEKVLARQKEREKARPSR